MIIEQAFYNLPEIMVGAGYAKQEYEGSIVSAFSLALLQELNGRNAQNPISFLHAERKLLSGGSRKLRADLYVDQSNLMVGSVSLSRFGFRFHNWIEAKFFRTGTKSTPPSTQNLGAVVADLIRLVALVPLSEEEKNDKVSRTGRYFLHVYFGDPLKHLNPNRKSTQVQDRVRKWVKPLISAGPQDIANFDLADETKTFFTHLGVDCKDVNLSLKVNNLRIEPVVSSEKRQYTFVLSRIDEFEFELGGKRLSIGKDRQIDWNGGEFDAIREAISSVIKPKKEEDAADLDDEEVLNDSTI